VRRSCHAAKIVIGDVRAALPIPGSVFRKQLDGRLAVDLDDALGGGRNHDKPQFLESEGRCVEHLPDVVRHVRVDALMPRGCDRIAFHERAANEGALQRVR
jgi:hypothetical protein